MQTDNFHEKINNFLQHQLLDGLINQQDFNELSYTAGLWQKLYIMCNCKVLGCELFSSRDVLAYLLELKDLKQISNEFFIQVAVKLLL